MPDRSERPRGAKFLRFGARWRRRAPRLPFRRPRSTRAAWVQLIALVVALVGAGAATQSPVVARKIALLMTGREAVAGIVREVIDGDSLVVGRTEIRLTDFDAPEFDETGGTIARAMLSSIVYGKEVVCTPCEGALPPFRCRSYDRILATCRLDGVRIGDLLRRRGAAEGGR